MAVPEHLRRFADDLEHASRGAVAPRALREPTACATLVGELRALILGGLRAGRAD